MEAFRMISLEKIFEPSSWAPCLSGPKTGSPSAWKASTMPATSGASGPTTVSSTALSLDELQQRADVFGRDVHADRVTRDAAVSGRAENLVDEGAHSDLPAQRMLPAA
jgi:hypothetical protein